MENGCFRAMVWWVPCGGGSGASWRQGVKTQLRPIKSATDRNPSNYKRKRIAQKVVNRVPAPALFEPVDSGVFSGRLRPCAAPATCHDIFAHRPTGIARGVTAQEHLLAPVRHRLGRDHDWRHGLLDELAPRPFIRDSIRRSCFLRFGLLPLRPLFARGHCPRGGFPQRRTARRHAGTFISHRLEGI